MSNTQAKEALTESVRILDHLKTKLRISTIDSREGLGVMNPAQRISELIKRGSPIGKDWTKQADSTGAVHKVRVYIWLGKNADQGDLFGDQFEV